MLRSYFQSSFTEFRSAVSKEKSKTSQSIRDWAAILVFRSAGKLNTNLVEDVEILLPVKFHRILFSGFRGEVENVSANQWPERQCWFSDRPEQHKLRRGRWYLVSCQVSLNSNQRFQRRSRKCKVKDGQTPGNAWSQWCTWTIVSGALKPILVEDVKYLLPVKFRLIPFSGC